MIHSRYQPQLEADRYIKALNPERDIGYFILIEPGLGYLIQSLRACRPDSGIVVLHADSCFRETVNHYPGVPMWFPDSGLGVQEFLEAQIPEGVSARIIEWRPSLNLYGDICLRLVRESAEFIKRAEADRRTGAAFGGRWVRNFFRNLALLDRPLQYRSLDMPIVITGSGPSLESVLPEIRAAREGVFILAASSSLPALAAGGITPDMVIATDGGGWALMHLHACFRQGLYNKNNEPRSTRRTRRKKENVESGLRDLRVLRGETLDSWIPKLALSLCAAVPSQCAELPMLVLNDGSLWQSMALHSIGVPSVLVPQRGTVTASALELAMVLGSGSIILTGMDLAARDIRTHARPYGFDHLFFGRASRLLPLYTQYFVRSGDMKAGGSHDVYAAWFGNKLSTWPQRIFSLGGNHAVFNSLPHSSVSSVSSVVNSFRTTLNVEDYFQAVTLNGSGSERRRHAVETLVAALDNAEYAPALCGELAPLLFPGRSAVLPAEIASALAALGGAHG